MLCQLREEATAAGSKTHIAKCNVMHDKMYGEKQVLYQHDMREWHYFGECMLCKETAAACSKTNSPYGRLKKTHAKPKNSQVFYAASLGRVCCDFDGKCELLT